MKQCDCKETCGRSGEYTDGSGGWWCPYIPPFLLDGATETECRRINDRTINSTPVDPPPCEHDWYDVSDVSGRYDYICTKCNLGM